MDDSQSTAPVDATDTSTNEEDAEAAMEDVEISLDDFAEEKPSKEEPEETAATESEEEPKSTEDETTEDVESVEETAQETKEVEPSEEDKRKAFNKEMAEKRIQEKQQREMSIKEQQEKYLEGIEDPIELATRQTQVEVYNIKVEANTNKLTNAYERAAKDFDVLRSDDPVIKARIDRALDAFQAQHVTLDAYGNPTNVRSDLYQYLQDEADSISQLTQLGKRTQVKDKAQEKSKTFTPPSRAPKEPKVDPDLEAFDEEVKKIFAG